LFIKCTKTEKAVKHVAAVAETAVAAQADAISFSQVMQSQNRILTENQIM